MIWLQVLNFVLSLVILALLLALGWSLRGVFISYLERLTTLYGTRDQLKDLTDKLDQVNTTQAQEIGSLRTRLESLPPPVMVHSPQEAELLSELWEALLSFQEAALDFQSGFDGSAPGNEGPTGEQAQRRNYDRTYRGLSTLLHRRRPFYPAQIFQALLRIMTLGDPQSLKAASNEQAAEDQVEKSGRPGGARERITTVVEEIDQVCELIRTHLMG
jgi:hypothetical protein